MTDVTSTPPALRWVALFLAACAVLGLFLGFRDQIRKNPPGWYTGAEQLAAPLTSAPDGSREATPYDPSAAGSPVAAAAPAVKAPEPKAKTADDATNTPTPPDVVPLKSAPPPPAPLVVPTAPRPKASPPTPRPTADPVGDILEGQTQQEQPAAVPY